MMPSSPLRDSPRYWLGHAALAGVAVVLVILVTSAYLRHTAERLACADWPKCATQPADSAQPPQPPAVAFARVVHRLSASLAGAAVLVIAYLSWAQRPRVRVEVAISMTLLVLTVFLAALGRWSKGSPGAWVTLGNLLGGMVMLVLLHWLWLRAHPHEPADSNKPRRLTLVAGAGLALALIGVSLGALTSALRTAPTGGALATAHLATGMVLLLLVATLAARLFFVGGGARALGITAVALALAQAMTGWVSTSFDYPLAAALTHNLLAALLLIALVTAAYRYAGSSRAHR